MSEEGKIPTATHTGEVTIGKVTLRVHHLDNGQRVIDEESMIAFMAALQDGSLLVTESDADRLAAALLG